MSSPAQAPLRYIDLFSGIGSFHHVLTNELGAECVLASDSDPHARATYEAWYGKEVAGRIEDIDVDKLPDYNLVCAGFPCQPFSLAGHQLGFADHRGTMFSHVMRFTTRPCCQYVILENVASLLTHDGGNSFRTICTELKAAGYTTTHAILKASDYGLPQMRKRLFIVGVRGADQGVSLDLPHVQTPTMTQLLGKHFDEKDIAYTIRCGGRRSGLGNKHNWDTYLVDGQAYVLSPRDCLMLQGFPEEWCATWEGTESQKYMRLGNTIPTCLARAVVNALIEWRAGN
jgi:DNA (cytosine-5)-methyltransferase 1